MISCEIPLFLERFFYSFCFMYAFRLRRNAYMNKKGAGGTPPQTPRQGLRPLQPRLRNGFQKSLYL